MYVNEGDDGEKIMEMWQWRSELNAAVVVIVGVKQQNVVVVAKGGNGEG